MKKIFLLENDSQKLYTKKSLKKKYLEKEKNQKKYGLQVNKKIFTVGFPFSLLGENNCDYFIEVLEGILEIGFSVFIFSTIEEKYKNQLEILSKKYKGFIGILEESEGGYRDMYSICDVCLYLKEDEENTTSCLSYGCVPVIFSESINDKILEFNPLLEKGNSFSIKKLNKWSIFESLIRANETNKFPYDWENLKSQCIESLSISD